MDDKQQLEEARKQVAEYALGCHFMGEISNSENEPDVIKSILSFINTLFMPEDIHYISLKEGNVQKVFNLDGEVEHIESKVEQRIWHLTEQHSWTVSGKGFWVKIAHQSVDLGILYVDRLQFPENKERYLNLTMAMTSICGLAIENARRNEKIKNSEKRLREEKERLEEALATVKTLKGLLPICSFCKKIRDDSGYWNQIELYIHEHADVEFSHSVCKECAEKFYPELDVYSEND